MSAAIITDVSQIDPFATNAVDIKATSLRECMTLMDRETGTPLMWLDHRVRSARNSGHVAWMAHDLETGRFETITLHANKTVSVLAK